MRGTSRLSTACAPAANASRAAPGVVAETSSSTVGGRADGIEDLPQAGERVHPLTHLVDEHDVRLVRRDLVAETVSRPSSVATTRTPAA